jgi:nucleotide-binding universal stress UspA family protein
MRDIFIGSNTEKIVRASGVPVIAVKDDIKPRQIKNIVFPNTMDSDAHEDLLMKVKELQHSLHANLHVVYINTPLNFKEDTVTRERLANFSKRYMLHDFTTHVFNDLEEERGVINFARMIDADMIAVGTHGRKGLAHLLSGSIAEDLVNHSKLPIWTYTIKK